jgi:hypothetical protein
MYYFPSVCAFGKSLLTFTKDAIRYDDIPLSFIVKVFERSFKGLLKVF